MKKLVLFMTATVTLVVLISGICAAAPSFFGSTGNILTPDDAVLSRSEFSANINGVNIHNSSSTKTFIGASVGLGASTEIGITRFDPDVAGAGSETIVNGKYRVLAETAEKPSVVIGANDITGQMSTNGNPGFYVVVGKNVTSVASNIAGEPVKPIKAYVGLGTGIYSGAFAAMNWKLTPRVTVIGEYLSQMKVNNFIDKSSVLNATVRFEMAEGLLGDVGVINGNDLALRLSYTKSIF